MKVFNHFFCFFFITLNLQSTISQASYQQNLLQRSHSAPIMPQNTFDIVALTLSQQNTISTIKQQQATAETQVQSQTPKQVVTTPAIPILKLSQPTHEDLTRKRSVSASVYYTQGGGNDSPFKMSGSGRNLGIQRTISFKETASSHGLGTPTSLEPQLDNSDTDSISNEIAETKSEETQFDLEL